MRKGKKNRSLSYVLVASGLTGHKPTGRFKKKTLKGKNEFML